MNKVDIHDYLVDKGYDISYSTVCNYVREHTKEAYIKQVYKPGKTLQFDYGEVKVNIAGENKVLNLALFTTGYGFYSYGKLYENKKIVNFLDAHVNAFKHFGGVHNEIVYDNLKQAVRRFVGPTEKEATEDLVKLSLYYKFNYRFCNARPGNPGTGKTHLSIGLGIKACNEGYSEKRLRSFEKKFEKYDLIILDELGYISFDKEGSELLFSFFIKFETTIN
ncbi:hypothetical protein [Selenihalanaerobacter shriftii]|uniref:Integrase core domain-containing protein n=1 Tax=Selenihalanaerobacter shriftii TaxID=142842 RepID=A0A1T4NVM9_9FIRM|nr:hypothetical protein SAMN02745118_01952 [Selenihalanaerobacter shriftii]